MSNYNPSTLNKFGELKQRILFVLGALIVYRIGTHIPVPGIDADALAKLFSAQQNTILGFFNMFSGGALQRVSLFALGVMPYISASIIMQLLTVVSPKMEQLKKEGESGRRLINKYTRYATVLLATIQAVGITSGLSAQGVVPVADFHFYFTATLSLVTGTLFLMWLGEQITERGIGNGISLLIFAGIVSGLPAAVANSFEQARQGEIQFLVLLMIGLIVLLVTAVVVFIERGQRRIVVNYARRQQGRQMFAAQSSHLPLKVNMAGVIPPIFASSIILFPGTLSQWVGQSENFQWMQDIALALSPGQPLYVLLYAVGIIFFCFFYTALVFNPKDTAENLKRSGAFIPGIRPGDQTTKYIDTIMSRLTLIGALYITSVSLLPEFLVLAWGVPFYFGGTSLLIVVVVVMDLFSQIQTYMMSQQYEAILKKANLKTNKLVKT